MQGLLLVQPSVGGSWGGRLQTNAKLVARDHTQVLKATRVRCEADRGSDLVCNLPCDLIS